MNAQPQKNTVYVDSDIIDLIPEFLENREKDLIALKKALEQNNYPAIQTIGHNLKGSGGSYGLDALSEIGKRMEIAALDNNGLEIRNLLEELSSYLQNIEVLKSEKKEVCLLCGNHFQPKADEKYCPQCAVDKQEKILEKSQTQIPKKKKQTKIIWASIVLVLLAVCAVVLIIQIPKIFEASSPGKPIRQGTYETDKVADECIKNLWVISRAFQENKVPDSSLRCPASNEPYRIESAKAFCPNPDKHGLKSLSVSKETKIPETLK